VPHGGPQPREQREGSRQEAGGRAAAGQLRREQRQQRLCMTGVSSGLRLTHDDQA